MIPHWETLQMRKQIHNSNLFSVKQIVIFCGTTPGGGQQFVHCEKKYPPSQRIPNGIQRQLRV